jgi:hypothetical protein
MLGSGACRVDGRACRLERLLINLGKWSLQEARAINRSGWIVGSVTLGQDQHGFLLVPVR